MNGMRIVRGAAAGLVAGLVASFVMNRFQAAVGPLLTKDKDGGEGEEQEDRPAPSTQQAADAVCRAVFGRDVPDIDKRSAGQAVHYVTGALLGAAYGIAAEFRPAVAAGLGAGFGLGTAVVLDDTIVPAAGWGPPVWKTDAATNLYSGASHLVFGTVCELVRRQLSRMLG